MVASDVHGKNHHVAGTFGRHVTKLVLRVADSRIVTCSPAEEERLFWATIGGMGLTGHILEVEFRLKRIPSPWIYEERVRYPDIDALMAALNESSASWPYTVAWADCMTRGSRLGRGILYRGRWATTEEAPQDPPRPCRKRFGTVRASQLGSQPFQLTALQRSGLPAPVPHSVRHPASGRLLLPARQDPALEPRLRFPRLYAVPMHPSEHSPATARLAVSSSC